MPFPPAQPARIVLTTFGSFGDLHPYLSVARELKRRGHSPLIATSEIYRDKICGEEIEFFPVRPNLPTPEASGDLIARVMHPTRGPEFLFRQLLMPHLRDSYDDLSQACRNADLFVTHPVTFAAPLVARKMKLPWISTVLSPISLWSLHDPPAPPSVPFAHLWPQAKRPINFALWKMARLITAHWLHPVGQLSREIGLQSTLDTGHPMFEGQHSPDRVLALFSSAFAQAQPDWPSQTRACGFCFFDRKDAGQAPLSPEIQNFLEDGEAPIIFTLGSAAVFAARDFFLECQQAARNLKRRAIYVLGDARSNPLSALTEDELAVDYAPYSSVFPHASIVVHQGGIGTTAQALRAGVPQLVVPFSHDQPDNAARIKRMGCGLLLPRQHFTSAHSARRLEAIIAQPKYFQCAREIASQMTREDGAIAACDEIESMLRRQRPHDLN